MNSMEQIINIFARSCENNNYVKYDIIIDIGKMEKNVYVNVKNTLHRKINTCIFIFIIKS